MANRPKARGTSFETACVRFLRERLGSDTIERRALHGRHDLGDIHGLVAHGYEGIVECKDYRAFGPADLERWKAQTVEERSNAGADFALLVVHRKGVGKARFGQNDCHMQVRDLERAMGGDFTCRAGESAKELWVSMPLETACGMMMGESA